MNSYSKDQMKDWIRWVSFVFFNLYLCYLIYLTLFDHVYGRQLLNRSINIIPFKTILQYVINPSSIRAAIINIVGNISAFIPMGFLLPLIFNKCRNFKMNLAVIIMGTICIEVAQYITGAGASDIDDIILNSLGGIIGYLICKYVVLKIWTK